MAENKKTLKSKEPKGKTTTRAARVLSVKSDAVVKSEVKEASKKSISLDVRGIDGKVTGKVTVPGEIFDAKVNSSLMAQAVRVYLANQRHGTASTKTRAEVQGSTRKIYRQKGTGRARHGAITAPIFVGGGITHGPRPHDFGASLPKKMRRAALFSALTLKTKDGQIVVVDGIEAVNGKTKEVKSALQSIELLNKRGKAEKRVLFITPSSNETLKRAVRNVENVVIEKPESLTTYEILVSNMVVFTKDALPMLESTYLKGDKK